MVQDECPENMHEDKHEQTALAMFGTEISGSNSNCSFITKQKHLRLSNNPILFSNIRTF